MAFHNSQSRFFNLFGKRPGINFLERYIMRERKKPNSLFTALFKMLILAALILASVGCGDDSSEHYAPEISDTDDKKGGGGAAAGKVSVEFKTQGGKWLTRNIPGNFWNSIVNDDGTVNLPTSNQIQRSGMIFVGWYTVATPVNNTAPPSNSGVDADNIAKGDKAEIEAVKEKINVEQPAYYLKTGEEIPTANIFTKNMKIKKNTTLYAWWQELRTDAKIVTFIPYWTENGVSFMRQAVPNEAGVYTVKNLPKVSGGPDNYHPVDENGKISETTWFTDISDGSVFTASTPVTSDMNVYGHWKGNEWKIIFDFNGGKNTDLEDSVVETFKYSKDAPNTAILSENKMPVTPPSAYKSFLGWFTTKRDNIIGAGVPAVDDPGRFYPGETVVNKEQTTVYALWQDSPADATIVNFIPYEGAPLSTSISLLPDDSGSCTLKDNKLPPVGSRNHYTPLDSLWYYKHNGYEKALSSGTNLPANSEITAYVKWAPKTYTVIFNFDDGVTNTPAVPVTYPGTLANSLPRITPGGNKIHSTSDGIWYVAKTDGGNNVQEPIEAGTVILGNITVSPNWVNNTYYVYFHKNDGADKSELYATLASAAPNYDVVNSVKEPARENWKFEGWYEKNGTRFTGGKVIEDKNVYAKWNEDELNITGITATYGKVAAVIDQNVNGSIKEYTFSIPAFVIRDKVPVKVDITASSTSGTSPIITIDNAVTSQITIAADTISASGKSVTVALKSPNLAKTATYIVTFKQVADTDKAMAAGGSIVKFVRTDNKLTTDDASWDEVHIFKSETTDFIVNRPLTGVKMLVTAGGGGGGWGGNGDGKKWSGNGGGAGGVIIKADQKLSKGAYKVTVGAGGSGGANPNRKDGAKGGDSNIYSNNSKESISGIAVGGGGGGRQNASDPGWGGDGGSGGGGFRALKGTITGAHVLGQGKNGGQHWTFGAAGGGGYSGEGKTATGTIGNIASYAEGGAGLSAGSTGNSQILKSIIDGLTNADAPTSYAAGGAGGGKAAGAVNTGNGGGGGLNSPGGAGGSGIIIARFPFKE
jgi:hypothetical protein